MIDFKQVIRTGSKHILITVGNQPILVLNKEQVKKLNEEWQKTKM